MAVETLLSHSRPQIQTRFAVEVGVNSEMNGDQLHIRFDVDGHPAGTLRCLQKFTTNVMRTELATKAQHDSVEQVRITMAPGVVWSDIRQSVIELTAQSFCVPQDAVRVSAMMGITRFGRF